jgi:hypothetical protein
MVKRLTGRLTYANVMATLAVFISLGGASFAAGFLPPQSVGRRQIRVGAVTPSALSFPLGAASFTDEKPEDLTKGACNSPLRPGEVAPPCVPPVIGGSSAGRELDLTLRAPGQLLISAAVGLRDEGAPGTMATLTIGLILDRREVSQIQVKIGGGQQLQIPLQKLAKITKGKHTIGLGVLARYSSNLPGDVIVALVSIIASALPAS